MITLDVSKLLGIEFAEEFNTATQKKESAPAVINRSTSTSTPHKGLSVKDLDEIESLLEKIPASCSYDEWFHVAAALKRKGVDYEVFRRWSATSSEKYDEAACERTWNGAADPTKPAVTLATLQQYANRYSGVEQVRLEMLPPPETMEEMTNQTLEFLDMFFKPGESFELVSKTWNQDGRTIPSRPGTLITMPESYMQLYSQIYSEIARCNDGAWFVFNPLRSKLEGTSARDADVTEFRYVLIEADSKTKEEQWEQLVRMHLPIKAVVWSGGKSLHAFVKIDAGTDKALFNERVRKLYDFLESKHMDIDKANKNPCRLSRIPGFYRGDNMQYLVAREMGTKDWETFERLYLNKQQTPEAVAENESDIAELINEYGNFVECDAKGIPNKLNELFFAAYVVQKQKLAVDHGNKWRKYNSETGVWEELKESVLKPLIAKELLNFSRSHNIPEIAKMGNNKNCTAILSFMEGIANRSNEFMQQRRIKHLKNGVLVFEDDGSWHLEPFSEDFYSIVRTELEYDPSAQCPMFFENFLGTAMCQDDMDVLQRYVGQCLFGENIMQRFLLLTGTAKGGKSTLVNLIKKLISQSNCTGLRLKHIESRFETARYMGKSLLTATDETSDFLNSSGAYMIKSLTGGDWIPAEIKGSNEQFEVLGNFNILISSNADLTVNLDSDVAAWRRRLLWIRYDNPPVPDDKKIVNFDDVLLAKEGSGILIWAL